MVRELINAEFRHFNARALRDAAESLVQHLKRGGRLMLTLGGAMSTAELGVSIAELIREGVIHAITTTGANLEEDVFLLLAHDFYKHLPDYRDLTPEAEARLLDQGLNRVTDVCIPEDAAIRALDSLLLPLWRDSESQGKSYPPHRYLYALAASGALQRAAQGNPKDSWVLAAAERDLPVWTPGWEDSTTGNVFAAHVMRQELLSYDTVVTGPRLLAGLADWYREESAAAPMGFFQIGGGISGDFAVAIVPLLRQDMGEDVPLWSYFCQISDSTTSYGSYSGATPNEKITWEKLGIDSSRHVIESDATICFPLIARCLLEAL